MWEWQCWHGWYNFFVFPIFCQSFLPHSLFSLNQKIFNLMQYNQEVKIVWTSLKVECQLLEGPVAKKKGMWHKLEDLWHQEAPPVFPSRKLDLGEPWLGLRSEELCSPLKKDFLLSLVSPFVVFLHFLILQENPLFCQESVPSLSLHKGRRGSQNQKFVAKKPYWED